MEDEEQIYPDHPERIALAHDAKEFISSAIGQYMLDRAARDAGDAAKELCDVDPNDTKRIIELQGQARILKNFNKWLDEIINTGAAEYAEYLRKTHEGE